MLLLLLEAETWEGIYFSSHREGKILPFCPYPGSSRLFPRWVASE